jgi:glycerol-3-phosphate acyltransferase PlsY
MLISDIGFIRDLVAAIVVGYLLGSIPFAQMAARYSGLNIFATGSRNAGAANVFWNVGHRRGALVLAGDVAKGSLAVLFAYLINDAWPVALLAGTAAVFGHWKSVFSRFRGGDGMAPLMGVAVALTFAPAGLGIIAGLVTVILLWRSHLRSAAGLVTSCTVMLAISQYYETDDQLILALAGLAALVLWRTLIGHRRRTRTASAALNSEAGERVGESDLARAAQENQ